MRPGHVQQHVRHQRALPAGVKLLEQPRHLADDALLVVVALLPASAVVVEGADVAVGEKVVPNGGIAKKIIIRYQINKRKIKK